MGKSEPEKEAEGGSEGTKKHRLEEESDGKAKKLKTEGDNKADNEQVEGSEEDDSDGDESDDELDIGESDEDEDMVIIHSVSFCFHSFPIRLYRAVGTYVY